MKKIYIFRSIFLLIGVFLSQAGGWTSVYADTTVLYQSYESGGTKQSDVDMGTGTYIGSFTPTSDLYFDNNSGVWVGVSWKNDSGFSCGGGAATIGVASTTSAFASSFLWTTDSMVNRTTYGFVSVTNSSGDPGQWLLSGHEYGIYMLPNCGANTEMSVVMDPLNLIYYGYLSWDGDYAETFSELAGRTRIDTVSPDDNETVSSSTPVSFGVTGYVNENDFDEDMFVRFRFVRQEDLQVAVANKDVLYTNLDVPITSSGAFNLYASSTESLEEGVYLLSTSIRTPSFLHSLLGWWGLSNVYDPTVLVEMNTQFIVGSPTILDTYISDMASTTNALLSDPGVFEDIADNCNPISGFDALGCITALFIPNNIQTSTAVDTLKQYVLTKAPVGYVTRLVTIVNTSATSSLPSISYTFGSGPLEGETFGWDTEAVFASSTEILTTELVSDQDDPQNVWDIFMPLWNTLVYAFLFVMVFGQITGIYQHGLNPRKK